VKSPFQSDRSGVNQIVIMRDLCERFVESMRCDDTWGQYYMLASVILIHAKF
jgi:hypothetical protein